MANVRNVINYDNQGVSRDNPKCKTCSNAKDCCKQGYRVVIITCSRYQKI